jgi:hypothetical protein
MDKQKQPVRPQPEDRRRDVRQQNPAGDRNRVSDKAADEPRQNKPKAKDPKK